MSLSRFFIDRPVFAWVVGLIIMLVGGLAITSMPIAQYPRIAPPMVAISVDDPGASADTVNNTVVRPILQQMSGLDHLEYLSAQSYGSGHMEIDLTFEQGTSPDIAQVQVQNKLQLAQPRLPPEVTAQGLSVTKASRNFMLVLAFISTDGSMSGQDVADYVSSNISDSLSRVSGVGDHQIFGSEYALRIWMDPAKLYQYGLTVGDVQQAVQAQNIQVASGELGGLPAKQGVGFDANIIGPTRLTSPEQFASMLLKVQQDGSQVRLKDIGHVELGAQSYNLNSEYNSKPAAAMALKLAPGANQMTTEKAVRERISELEKFYPQGLKTVYPLDTEPFITHSISEVIESLVEAIALVFIVMLVFLQNFRATLIPTIAVPVVLLGTFGVLSALGYTINTLTMLAMVLAVGLLVDDAIVVVENVERVMSEKKLSPKEAARVSMDEISGALVGIVLVLSAVFLPMAAFGGSTGVIYRQFSITVVAAMWLSVVVAMVMTPALCATMLKPIHEETKFKPAVWFNWWFDRVTDRYVGGVKKLVHFHRTGMVIFVLVTCVTVFLFMRVPGGFLPDEDQGIIFGQISMPAGSTNEQTSAVNRRISDYVLQHYKKDVASVFSANGFSFAGQGQSAGAFFIRLKPWDERPGYKHSTMAIANDVMKHFWGDPDAQIFAVNPPPVMELGNGTGFDLELEDNAHLGHQALVSARNKLLGAAAKDPLLAAVRPMGLEDAPQYVLDIDREKANAQGISNADINTTIQGAFGSIYVNQFTRNDRVKQVYIQGDASSRMRPEDLNRWYVRNSSGGMVPFNAFASGHWIVGPQKVENYNGINSFELQGQPAAGVSSGKAMSEMERLMQDNLPQGIGHEWTGISFEQRASGSSTGPLYALATVVILFCLAALYESWAIPISVLLVLPLGVLGAILATLGRHLSNDVYFQVGLLTTVGLSVKNAILIVEFAKAFYEEGDSLDEAVLKASRERLRPILMTSIAFVCGVFPLAIATGAGSAARVAIGTCVVGGMISATLLAVYFVPLFFVVTLRLFNVKRLTERHAEETAVLEEIQAKEGGSMIHRSVAWCGLSVLLMTSACNLAPKYHQPDSKVPTTYPKDTYSSGRASTHKVSDLGWEDFFTDPRLKKLIELTLLNNRDLAAQMAAVMDQRGQYQVQNAALFPTISAGGSGMYVSPSEAGGFAFAPGSGRGISTLRFYQTSIGFSSYEIDLWGRVRNLTRSEKEQTLSAAENLRNLWITTVSQVAETYIQWLADRQLLSLAQKTHDARQKTWELTKLSYDHGQVDALMLAQVSSQLEQTNSDIARQTRSVADDEHALQLLVGTPIPHDLPLPVPMGQQTMTENLPEGLPFDLLTQRPDIQAAEHILLGANASVGAARAAFLPRVTLTASEGTSALMFRKLFTGMAETWSISPNISIPLLTWGQNQGNLKSAKAKAAQGAAQYQKAVQSAFREVADALTARETYRDQDESIRRYVMQSQQAYDLAQMRFRSGIDTYLTTLEQERQLYTAQQSQVAVQAARFQNTVTLYRALGGGWSKKSHIPTVTSNQK